MSADSLPLDGTIHLLPFDGGPLDARIAPIYSSLLDATGGDPRDVLVLKRLPTGIDEFAASLREHASLTARPNVNSLPHHSRTVFGEARPDVTLLSYEERIEFLARVVDGYNWSPYFERASAHDSFDRDVGRLLLEATWQGGFDRDESGPPDDPRLAELAAINDSLHEKLDERGLAERAETISRAIEELEREPVRERIEREFDAVLVVEFEECAPIDREYLASLTRNADLVCVAETHASIDRIRKEAGSVRRLAGEMTLVDHTDEASVDADDVVSKTERSNVETDEPDSETEAVTAGTPYGTFLATGRIPDESPDTPARLIAGETLDQQIEAVANEIEYLRHEHGYDYDDVAVLLRTVDDSITRVRRVLHRAGVPTAAVGVNGFGQDLAVRELHALAQYRIDGDESARTLLEARVDDLDPALLEGADETPSIAERLDRWILETDLKRRIATEHSTLDAREQFENVSRIRSIADFVDSQDVLAGDWVQFRSMLERAIAYDAPYTHASDVSVPDGGVTVAEVDLVKNDSRPVVFLLDVVDGEYPGIERLSPLFPTPWITEMDGYPAVTQPTEADVTETYATVTETAGDEFERYHAEWARRQLAIGSRAAEDRLYFCTYRQADGSIGRLQHRSRYLHAIENCPDLPLEEVGGVGVDRDIHTLGAASTELLSQPWAELERIRAEASAGGEVSLESAEETLAAVQATLDESESVDPRFERAVETQFDLARGSIRPTVGPRMGGDDD
ncbi:hypothetical protein ACLI4Z_19295 [Natrialbaceae archaeon A-arb3/5]